MSLQKLLNRTTPRRMFFIDSIGAAISAIMLGLVLAQLELAFGMPAKALYVLATIASIFATYSLLGYLGKLGRRPRALKVIVLANLAYCGLSIGLMIYFHESLTVLGYAYFILEKVTVISLAFFEWKVSTRQDLTK